MRRIHKIVFLALAFLLAVNGIPTSFATQANAAVNDYVSVSKTVNPTTITTEQDAEVNINLKGVPLGNRPKDIILVIDKSGSMNSGYGSGVTKITAAKSSAKGFIDLIDFSKDRIGIVDFSNKQKTNTLPLSTDKTATKNYIDRLTANGASDTGNAIDLATIALANHRPEAQPVIIIMTDATQNPYDNALQKAQAAKNAGIVFYTIALLSPNDNPETSKPNIRLEELASTPQFHHFVLGTSGLPEIYANIVKETGIESAFNVVVTDTVSPDFDIVSGSYDNNSLKPTVSGNTLTWKIQELNNNDLVFKYRIKPRDPNKTGSLPVATATSNISYLDYAGASRLKLIPNANLNVIFSAPVITSIVNNSGSPIGGETVTINGSKFRTGATVSFGAVSATNVQVISSTRITATVPSGNPGSVTVTVTNPDNQKATTNYSYILSAPQITAITPNSGSIKGGEAVTISGSNFVDGVKVYFGSNLVPVGTVSSTQITLTTPSAPAGAVDVKVVNSDGQQVTLTGGYTFIAPPAPPAAPAVSQITPNSGSTLGGEAVTINGSDFVDGVKVYFGSNVVTVDTVQSTKISLTTPSAPAGAVDVRVVNPDGQQVTLTGGYTFIAPPAAPAVSQITPNSGSTLGGEAVTINGSDFVDGVKVYFGSNVVTVDTVQSTKISLTTPSAPAGAVDVRVVNPDGQQVTLTGGYTFIAPPAAPAISQITPNSGSTLGGEAVTINGSDFVDGVKVYFGSNVVTVDTVQSTKISLTTPSAPAGAVDVRVVNPDGQQVTLTGGYTFIAPPAAPAFSQITPNSGSTLGGEAVTISGSNFVDGVKVYFGSNVVPVDTVSSTQITLKTPSAPAGAVDVRVVNPDGQQATLTGGYTFIAPPAAPAVSQITPNSGSTLGGEAVTINGSNFVDGVKVYFGSNVVPVDTVSSTQITLKTPSAPAGAVDVRVVNPDGQQATLTGGYTFIAPPAAPAVSQITPNSGSTLGGEAVTINGSDFVDGVKVYFGSNVVTVDTVQSTKISLTTPSAPAGAVDVRVVNPDGQQVTLTGGYTFIAPPAAPAFSQITPNSGSTLGGEAVTINGSDFVDGVKVYFGSNVVTVDTVQSTKISLTTPSAPAGAVDVRVVNPDGQQVTLTGGYTFIAPPAAPAFSQITPNSGSTLGGEAVTINGSDFVAGVKVYFGSNVVPVGTVSSTQITLKTPSAPAGAVDVRVVNPDGQQATLTGGYTFIAPPATPAVSQITPNSGSTLGGEAVTINGSDFVDGVKVYFGSNVVTVDTVQSTKITLTTPSAPAGTVDVRVVNPDGQQVTLTGGYTFIAPPVEKLEIQSVTPNAGLVSGGDIVYIVGTKFESGLKVYFGNDEAPVATYYSGQKIKVTSPKVANAGTVDVKVVNPDNTSATLAGGFTYNPLPVQQAPSITDISPNSGPIAGGDILYINGANFVQGMNLFFGSTQVPVSTFYSSSRIKVVSPASTLAGPVDVKVVNPDGQETTLASGYTFIAPPPPAAPVVTTLTPNSGEKIGGEIIYIDGQNFVNGVKIYFGSNQANVLTYYSASRLKVSAPSSTIAGQVDVKAVNPDSQEGTLAKGYTYLAPAPLPAPQINTLTPNKGLMPGGELIVINGTGFQQGATVTFGNTTVNLITFTSATKVSVTAPSSANLGTVDVKITNPDGQSFTFVQGYTYELPVPTITNLTPNHGPLAGGTIVYIDGTNFDPNMTVKLNGQSVPISSYYGTTRIKIITPSSTVSGSLPLVFTNPGGATATSAFTYDAPPPTPAPVITKLSATSGTVAGGEILYIDGTGFSPNLKLYFGSTEVPLLTYYSDLRLKIRVPAGTLGFVAVKIVNPDGQQSSVVQYEYK
ncbi:hypothetical protein QFZ77_000797 [Paenibacillus sp. V4I3]|uniref:IPT/TIG domain-containing protein n=1 Tax=Paenibacillus sp. V4I3 TaxID=3042305 RepID=UPI00277EA95D|nr:IPT/TIG domain-containing protein [Paenibacillus sp. V4I3]MDQ0872138.1 hypothetical protein [Paenibacillus sp. V4I3]